MLFLTKMKTLTFTLLFYLLLPSGILATTPQFHAQIIKEKQMAVNNQNFNYPPEITPLVTTESDGTRLYVLPTSHAHLCKSTSNILNSSPSNPLYLPADNCRLIAKPEILNRVDNQGNLIYGRHPTESETKTGNSTTMGFLVFIC